MSLLFIPNDQLLCKNIKDILELVNYVCRGKDSSQKKHKLFLSVLIQLHIVQTQATQTILNLFYN